MGEGVGLHERVRSMVGELLGLDGPAAGDADLLSDLGFDSLAYAELATLLAEREGIDLLDGGMTALRTVGDLCSMVDRAAAGPVVLCMNHESMLDIPAVAVATPRPITFMAKRELFGNRRWARMIQRMGAFSVDRDLFDLRAIQVGLEVIRRGEVLGMYPEGTRTPRTLLPFLGGAPWVALATGSPLLPCGIAGTEEALPRGSRVPKRVPIRVAFAPPIEVEQIDDPVKRRAEAERLAGDLRVAIAPL